MRTRSVGLLALASLGILSLATPGCAAESTDDSEDAAAAITKPDLKARFADLRRVDTRNLAAIAVNLGSQGINSALKVSSKYAELGVTLQPTNVFGAQAEENSVVPSIGKVKGINDISAALATQLGEKEFPVELAKLRLQTISGGQDKYFVETGFGIKGALGLDLGHTTGGFGDGPVSVHVGFKKGQDLEAHVVVATPEAKLGELVSAQGEAIEQLRGAIGGFVIPESADQISKMKAGEAIGLKGKGTFAANFGVGVPILIANAGPFAYSLAVSGGLSHAVEGTLDVEVVRLGGDEVAIDVGITDAKLDEHSFGITGGWGVNEMCDDGARCLDTGIAKIVRNGLAKKLGAFMKTSVTAGASDGSTRIELARARFHLGQPEVAGAIEQALHGDLRYAQALASRGLGDATPSVKFDFDMMRAATASSRTFGAEVFGLDIYHRVAVEKSGSFAIQTPDGVQSVLWNTFEKRSGWFQMDHGSKLTAISSSALDAANPDKAINQANLVVQTVVGDAHMDDDVLLDSADGLIVALAGKDALAPLDKFGTPMEQAIGRECPVQRDNNNHDNSNRDTWDEQCNVKLIQDETKKVVQIEGGSLSLVDARKRGVDEFAAQPAIANQPASYKELLRAAAELRLTLNMVKIHGLDATSGPGVSFALDYRLDDKALALLAQGDEAKYRNAVMEYFATVGTLRDGINGGTVIKEEDAKAGADAMLARFQIFKASYKNIRENESRDLPRILAGKPYINLPIGIRFDVSDVADPNSPERMQQYLSDVNRIRVESISLQRALLGKDLFDGLAKAADKKVGFSSGKQRLFAEQAAAYPLMAAVPQASLEVGMDLSADVKSTFWNKRERFIKAGFAAQTKSASGGDVQPIANKLFDLTAMMNQR